MNKKDRVDWQETILFHFYDEKGNLKKGWDYGLTPEELIKLKGEEWNGNRSSKLYRSAQISLFHFCQMITSQGEIAGGVSNCPTVYMIAKDEKDQSRIFNNRLNNDIGRIERRMIIGKGLMQLGYAKRYVGELKRIQDQRSLEE